MEDSYEFVRDEEDYSDSEITEREIFESIKNTNNNLDVPKRESFQSKSDHSHSKSHHFNSILKSCYPDRNEKLIHKVDEILKKDFDNKQKSLKPKLIDVNQMNKGENQLLMVIISKKKRSFYC